MIPFCRMKSLAWKHLYGYILLESFLTIDIMTIWLKIHTIQLPKNVPQNRKTMNFVRDYIF